MPTYDYRCSACGKQFEMIHSMQETGDRDCPKCGAPSQRMISGGSGFIMKGSAEPVGTQCGSATTCCGSKTPCSEPHCG
jgi:putative FmdB family regulatory protein